MNIHKYFTASLLVLLVSLAIVHSAPTEDLTHNQVVEEAIAEAENEQTPIVGNEEPAAEDATDVEEVPEATDEGERGEEEEPLPEETNLEEKTEEKTEEIPSPAADADYDDQDIISLPHLPDPKYDNEGDLVWFPRIIGGSRAQLGEYPSKVSLQTRSGSHFCGGNLITNNHILSAAHCVVTEEGILLSPASIEIMAGDISITGNPGRNRVFRIVSHIFVHTGYDSHTMDNDIAVLRVSMPFTSVDSVLYPEPIALGVPITGTKCHLAGWGATTEGSNNASPNLMRVNLEIVDTHRCNISYQGMIGAKMFCAGTMTGGRDACQGDSGGGLMCEGVITGVVSFGYGCGRPRFPGVYTDVSAYAEFIESSLSFEGAHDDIPQPEFRPSDASSFRETIYPLFVMLPLSLLLIVKQTM